MVQYGFLVNTDKCVACRSCVMACKEKHNFKPGRKFRKLHSMSSGSWKSETHGNFIAYDPNGNWETGEGGVFSYSLSMSCCHCAEPACMTVCPAGAIGKRDSDGIVFIDRNRCTGCKSCATACPYGAPSYDAETNKMEKCDMCRELQSIGESPACVAACSMNALEYNDLEILKLKYPQAVQQVAPLEGAEKTNPSLLIMPHRKYRAGMDIIITSLPEELQSNDQV